MRRTGFAATMCGVVALCLVLASFTEAADAPRFTRSEVEIEVPDVTLIDQRGNEVGFREMVLGDKPVYVEFIFATCTTICPVLSAGFASMQRKLGDESVGVLPFVGDQRVVGIHDDMR